MTFLMITEQGETREGKPKEATPHRGNAPICFHGGHRILL